MRAKLYRGETRNAKYPYFLVHFNTDYDVSNERDEFNNPLKFIKEEIIKGDIVSWTPFVARYKGPDGKEKEKRFLCPKCNSNNVTRDKDLHFDDPHFFQGNFYCADCGAGKYNYHSDSFYSYNPPKELTLFDNQ